MSKGWLTEYAQSIEQTQNFWAKKSQIIDWISPWQTVSSGSFKEGNIKWFEEGELNACYNCVDRHLQKHADKVAFYWEGDNPEHSKSISYQMLYEQVNRFANVLKSIGVKKGDVVCIYLPMIVEAPVAMLACARIGAIHSVIFGGFSPVAIADRVNDAQSKFIITADGGFRGGKAVALKANVDEALKHCPSVEKVLVIKYANNPINWNNALDVDYKALLDKVPAICPVEVMKAEDPLFILYTSGSTGKPKGVVHTTAGYLVYAATTHKHIFDLQHNDVYWCTADVGWITGHSYVVYGPLVNATTSVLFEGVPSYPQKSRFFDVVDKYKVSIFYTAPTAIRALQAEGDNAVLAQTTRDSLRILGSVGEPINREAWHWYHEQVGKGQCAIVDTWWQTETGGIMISPDFSHQQKPGSAMTPFWGVDVAILDKTSAKEVKGALEAHDYGALVIKKPWPGMMRSLWGDHERYMQSYFNVYPGYYFPGDGAYRDQDNHYWISGRLDDVISIAGHRIGTAEVESVIDSHPAVAETAVVGIPDSIKGEVIYAYITLEKGVNPDDSLKKEIIQWVRKTYGPIASIKVIQWAPMLPKTRSGKIMRRILRKIAHFEEQQIGDTSTLADESCVKDLILHRVDYRKTENMS
ncbi:MULTISPECIES: acetate--CoA ligase [Cysteiniphilum]|uniref:Acetate--CoA ligase n=1 Tax=Cysteiniphilum litorale TaxID=2056700 RepID=A0A8J2Z5M5_9GAMM|nr:MULTISPECIES: acetate--CoA ligase [Cysteiniphilum]GGG03408.1 acetyl-coenzyme A synthetase [Cysteiniphilum litorale]